jgi:hypothetical protein
MKVLIVRHAQSENNLVQAEAHLKMANGELSAEDAQVICLTKLVDISALYFLFVSRRIGLLVVMTTRGFQKPG